VSLRNVILWDCLHTSFKSKDVPPDVLMIEFPFIGRCVEFLTRFWSVILLRYHRKPQSMQRAHWAMHIYSMLSDLTWVIVLVAYSFIRTIRSQTLGDASIVVGRQRIPLWQHHSFVRSLADR
jgi:hypothetical protein